MKTFMVVYFDVSPDRTIGGVLWAIGPVNKQGAESYVEENHPGCKTDEHGVVWASISKAPICQVVPVRN